jgi:hypothetical protein
MLLTEPELVSLFDHQVGLEGHVKGNEDASVGQESNVAKLEGPDPLEDTSILVYDFALLEVEGVRGVLGRHFDEGLVSEGRMVDIFLELEEPVEGSAEELRVAKPVGHILVLFLLLDRHIILVSLAVVVVAGDGTMESFLFPLENVLEGKMSLPGSICDEAVFVFEGPDYLVVDVPAGETQVWQVGHCGTVRAEVGVDTGSSSFVGPVQSGDGVPYFSLYLEIVFEIIYDGVVLFDLGFVVVLIEFGCNVVMRVRILMGKCGVGFIVEHCVFLDEAEIGFLFIWFEDRESVVLVGAEASSDRSNPACQHHTIQLLSINSKQTTKWNSTLRGLGAALRCLVPVLS